MSASEFEKYRLEMEDLAQNPATRLPICICVDASYSMKTEQRMQKVNNGIRTFIKEIEENYYAVDSVELCIISFGGEDAEIVQEFSNVRKITFQDMKASGKTPLGKAVSMAIQKLNNRRTQYEGYGIPSYKPWLILLSDGASTDQIDAAVAELKRMQKDHQIKVLCVGVGDEPNDLAQFKIDGEVFSLKALELDRFFSWLSKSMSEQSRESPYEEVSLLHKEDLLSMVK